MLAEQDIRHLKDAARAIRLDLLRMHHRVQAGHLGTGLSAVEILTLLYGRVLRNPAAWAHDPQADCFILGKGHGASALYATLRRFGQLSDADFESYYADGTLLPAHPAPRGLPAIPAATGSLGHGLPIATGLALAIQQWRRSRQRVFVLLSDGDCNEGSTWEAALFAGHHRLDALTVIVDCNGLQGFGRTSEVLDVEPLAEKWRAFRFETVEADGHDFAALDCALQARPAEPRPRCIIARTIKGKGVSFMEDRLEWHYLPLSDEQFGRAIAEVEDAR